MNTNNQYQIGFFVVMIAYITLVAPEVYEYIHELFNTTPASPQAIRQADFLSLLINGGVIFFIIGWFSGKYK